MASFDSGGVRIHYEEHGRGEPVLLVHGFGSSAREHWGETGVIDFLAGRYRVIAPDSRGHGLSDKPHELAAYGLRNMAHDVLRLLDHLGIERTLLMGYSMGGRISLHLLGTHAHRLRAVVLGGMGAGAGGIDAPGERARIAAALRAENPDSIPHVLPRRFRQRAEAKSNDLIALAACIETEGSLPDMTPFRSIQVPVLLLVGTKDSIAGSVRPIVKSFGCAELVEIEGGEHITTPRHPLFKEAVARFLAAAPA
jgi:pimeloyl-ACP methyl ester carboxylesterase